MQYILDSAKGTSIILTSFGSCSSRRIPPTMSYIAYTRQALAQKVLAHVGNLMCVTAVWSHSESTSIILLDNNFKALWIDIGVAVYGR